MLSDITLGQYYPTRSLIHSLDPRAKIIMVLATVVMLFCFNSPVSYLINFLFILICLVISRVPFSFILKGLKPVAFIVIFTAFLNLFLTDGREIARIWFLRITYEGVEFALFMSIRIILLVAATTILTLTTSPIMLTNAIERLLRPLKVIKFPAHELAMMMTIALRFIPTLLEETDKIMKAQASRGADFEKGNLITKVKALLPILIPLFVNAFKRADELALAMECRCYKGGEGRTQLKEFKLKKNDYIGILVFAVYVVVLILTMVIK